MNKRWLSVVAVLALTTAAGAEEKIDFAKQIRPILADTCYKCHGEKKQKGKLRLDSLQAFEAGGKNGKVIVPGNVDKSELYRRIILPKDDDDVMPPEGDPLPKEKTQLIKQWIAQGAPFGSWKSDVGTAAAPAGPTANTPAASKLPDVPAGDPASLAKVRQSGALAMPLAQGTNLLEVDYNLIGDRIGDSQLADLQPIAVQIAVLNLARTKISDAGLKAISGFKNLRQLHLENTPVGDAGMAYLKDLSNLEYLNLYRTGVTDSGLTQLEGLKNLRALYLWQTKVTPAGVEKLKKALPNCQINTGWETTK